MQECLPCGVAGPGGVGLTGPSGCALQLTPSMDICSPVGALLAVPWAF